MSFYGNQYILSGDVNIQGDSSWIITENSGVTDVGQKTISITHNTFLPKTKTIQVLTAESNETKIMQVTVDEAGHIVDIKEIGTAGSPVFGNLMWQTLEKE